MSIIQVENLVKKYKKSEQNAVDDISFNVKEGEFFAFLGPNGAGKTTTISILTTTLSKTSGRVLIDDLEIDKNSSEIRNRVGIIFQKPSLDLNLSAEENIRFHCVLYGLYTFSPFYRTMPKDYKKRVTELAGMIGIDNDLNKPVKEFSGGMKRKLEIIRSLMHSPKILFLDEPTIGLDPDSRQTLWDYIIQMKESIGMTVFLTTHYLDEVEDADNICIINKGKIVATGSPEDVKKEIVNEYVVFKTALNDTEKLRNEAVTLGYKAEIDENKIKVFASKYEDVKQLLNSIKTPIEYFNVHKPTMEDAYLKIIRQENLAA